MTSSQYQVSIMTSILFFIFMIVMNILANALPINGQTTGGVSYRYPNLLQPSGFTFSIWGLIYLMLGGVFVYFIFQWKTPIENIPPHTFTILLLFALSSIFNVVWLILWHHERIFLSTVVMVALLSTLIVALHLSHHQPLLIRSTLSVYTGWISIATIANISILLVSLGSPSFSNKAVIYAVFILIIGLMIGMARMVFYKDIIFGLVFVWAYFGILTRHIRQESLPQQFPIIIWVTSLCLLLLITGVTHISIHLIKNR